MRSPEGNGDSSGEGRKGALLLLRDRPREADGTSKRASTLPSSNALRPDSGLNLGWYRPAAPEERPAAGADRNEWSSGDEPRGLEEPHSIVTATATRVDLRANPAPSDPNDSPLGARRPRRTPTGSSQHIRRRETGLAPVGAATVRRWAAILLAPVAREVRKRPRAVGTAAVLLVAFAVVTALEQPGVLFATGSPAPPRHTSHPQSPAGESSGAPETRRPPDIVLGATTHHPNRRSRPASHSPDGAHHHASTAVATSAAAKASVTVTASRSTVSGGSAASSSQASPVQTRATTSEPISSSLGPSSTSSGSSAGNQGSASSAQPPFGSNGTLGPGSSPQS
jgi:hypothetical protein